MSLSDEERQTLVRMELQKAHDAYEDIGILQQAGRWSGAANRLYYAVFHAVNALFIHDGHQSNSHKGSHALFSMH
ncbi:MAG: HEPN domain-containing protein, partial [Bacteroidaceae bacterium]|nr:HEPN domain-containing protein [Bacteroidaceae bacterium]